MNQPFRYILLRNTTAMRNFHANACTLCAIRRQPVTGKSRIVHKSNIRCTIHKCYYHFGSIGMRQINVLLL